MPHTLLLADDSVTIQRVIELTFADEDIRVVAVSDGEQAITAMADAAPDIVLVDAAMPGRNGYEVAEHMRRTPGLTEIPVLLLAGAFEPIDKARADAARCGGVLVKPFEPQQLIARVQELLTRPPGADRPADSQESTPAAERRTEPVQVASLDDYFDRLDKALGGSAAGASVESASASEDLMTWFASKRPAPEPPPTAVTATPPSVPLAGAFLALLDAERAGTLPAGPTLTPSETLVEAVAARVLDRLSDRVVRAAVSDVVSAMAERLAQDEIERIRAAAADLGEEDGAGPAG